MAAPSTALLDSLSGLVSGARVDARAGWLTSTTGKLNTGDSSLKGNTTLTDVNPLATPASNFWATSFGPDSECGITVVTVDSFLLHTRIGFTSNVASRGYLARIGFSGAISIETYSTSSLATGTITAPAVGDIFCLQSIGNVHQIWKKPISTGIWGSVLSVTNTTYPLAGVIGITCPSGDTPRLKTFFGGTVVAGQPTGAMNGNAGVTGALSVFFPNVNVTPAASVAASAVATVKTPGLVLPGGAAPTASGSANVLNGIPSTGELYGMPWNADSLNNIEIGSQVGRLVGLMFKAKTTTTLSRFAFALAYGSGYSLGTGGSVKVELFADDGSTLGAPTGSALATQTLSTPVGAPSSEAMIEYSTFVGSAAVVAGNRYHLVMTQMDASPTANWVSLDGTYNATPITAQLQPAYANKDFQMKLFYSTSSPGWIDLTDVSPSPVNIHFADGTDLGWSVDYTPVAAALRTVGGTSRVRMNITPTGVTRVPTKVWVRLYRQTGTTQPLTIAVQNSSRTVLASANVAASAIIALTAGSSPADGTWVSIPLSGISIVSGTQLFLELSSPSETVNYQIYPMRTAETGNWSDKALTNRFGDGFWEYSTNSGTTWTEESSDVGYKMQFYFEIPGGVPQNVNLSASAGASAVMNATSPTKTTMAASAGASAVASASVPISVTMAGSANASGSAVVTANVGVGSLAGSASANGSASVTTTPALAFGGGSAGASGSLSATTPAKVTLSASAQASSVLAVTTPTLATFASSAGASANATITAPTALVMSGASSSATGNIAVTGPVRIGSLNGSAAASGNLSVSANSMITANGSAVASGTLVVTASAFLNLGGSSVSTTGAMMVAAPALLGMTAAAQSSGAATITAPTFVSMAASASASGGTIGVTTPGAAPVANLVSTAGANGTLGVTTPGKITFAQGSVSTSGSVLLTAPALLSMGVGNAAASASMQISGPTRVTLGSGNVSAAGSLSVSTPNLQSVGSISATGSAAGSVSVTGPTRAVLGAGSISAVGSATVRAPALLGAFAGTSTTVGTARVAAAGLVGALMAAAQTSGTGFVATPVRLQPDPAQVAVAGTLTGVTAGHGRSSTRTMMGMGM